eukprot:31564-Pelagococcus_subviridis.AAC.13
MVLELEHRGHRVDAKAAVEELDDADAEEHRRERDDTSLRPRDERAAVVRRHPGLAAADARARARDLLPAVAVAAVFFVFVVLRSDRFVVAARIIRRPRQTEMPKHEEALARDPDPDDEHQRPNLVIHLVEREEYQRSDREQDRRPREQYPRPRLSRDAEPVEETKEEAHVVHGHEHLDEERVVERPVAHRAGL